MILKVEWLYCLQLDVEENSSFVELCLLSIVFTLKVDKAQDKRQEKL
jgi:hypothetical protein